MRYGRPPRELAGQVEERILDAASRIFLNRGLEGATIDEIAEAARASKPTIYARFANKEALFCAAISWKSGQAYDREVWSQPEGSVETRLTALALSVVDTMLVADKIGLMRVTLAESCRFPDLAQAIYKQSRRLGNEAIAELLSEFAQAGDLADLPAFAPERLHATAHRFTELVLLPIYLRALLGEDFAALRAEAASHIEESVAFFLAAVRSEDCPACCREAVAVVTP